MAGRILVIDDEANFADMVKALLEKRGYQAEITTDPQGALNLLSEETFSLVVVDYKMPEMDGAQFLEKARKINPEQPVIMISGLMNTPDLLRVANQGVTLVLEKPFDTTVFLDSVARFVSLEDDDEDDARAAPAPDAEPSEELPERAYPQGVRPLSDESWAMVDFLNEAWSACQRANSLFIVAPYGSELKECAQAISRWKGFGDAPTACLSAHQINPDALADKLADIAMDNRQSNVAAINGLEDLSDSEQVAWGEALLAAADQPACKEIFLLLCCYDEAFPLDEKELKASPLAILGAYSGLARMPALKDRPADLLAYACETLGRAHGSPRLSADGLRCLLRLPWPGNKAEMQDTLSRAAEQAGDTPIGEAAIRASLRRSRRTAPAEEKAECGLRAILAQEQGMRLQRIFEKNGGDFAKACKQAVAPIGSLNPNAGPTEQPFLWPELLERI